ncbi:DUF721 domain-containing protein [Engelhardtia mirabilis]|uniref:DUF721 domain-containing protein n=1 Tax=Engelhardtia mirabilis TaxID=2528011 RepID=A0A518BD96_9BACT|nr:hypothetical protein Pla133_00030 [Planctomycetes bacterium Pla133]QDU99268.1 hypothetical protein Pla86_00030 [Planctomycetes bacterium Pla86]
MTNGRPGRGGSEPTSFGELLGEITHAAGLDRPKRTDPVFDAWNEVAGVSLAAVARPVRFRQGELSIDVSSASHYHELVAFHGEGLRKRLNEVLGDERVKRLVFKHQAGT